MKVALFTDSDVFAGTERHIAALAAALREENVDVSVACPDTSPLAHHTAELDIPVIDIQKRGAIDLAAISKLRRMLRRGEVDIVHAHNGRTALQAAIAVRTAGAGRCIMTQHFLRPNHTGKTGPIGLAFHLVHRWMNSNLDQVIAISAAVREAIIARKDVPAARITEISNGIADIPVHAPAIPDGQPRQELNLDDGNVLVLCVARLQKEKNVSSLVAAMAEINARNPGTKIRCLIVGSGVEADSIADQIQQSRLSGLVRMIGHRSDIPSLMVIADMLVLPSIAEPFGLVLVEAMAAGIPVIATRAGGPIEIVQDSVTGLLIPPNDPSALALAIERLAGDPSLCERMGNAARQRFTERYTAGEMAKKTAALYRKIADGEWIAAAEPLECVSV